MKELFDRYVWCARVLPGVLVLSPPVVALLFAEPASKAVFSELRNWAPLASGWLLALALVVRFCGKRIESRLWHTWGGPPTTSILRWSDARHAEEWKNRIHDHVAKLTGISLLTREEEALRPDEADRRIDDVCGLLRTRTRNLPSAQLLRKANSEYGMARNLLGSRWVFILTSAAAVVISLFDWYARKGTAAAAGLIVSLAFLGAALVLGLRVLPTLVRQIAERYAEELWSVVATLGTTDRKDTNNG